MEFDELRRRALAGDKKAVDDLKKLENELKKKAAAGDQDAIRKLKILDDDRFYALRQKALAGDQNAIKKLKQLKEDFLKEAAKGDLDAKRKLKILEDDEFESLMKRGLQGDKNAINALRKLRPTLDQRAKDGDAEAVRRLKRLDDLLKQYPESGSNDADSRAAKEDGAKGVSVIDDNQSDLSLMMVKSSALQNFGKQAEQQLVEVPPSAASRRFNECDVIGNLDRDEKGNVVTQEDGSGNLKDKDGFATNERGYLVDPKTGGVINNLNNQQMFGKHDLDDRGELPAPFNVEKHNFNPHEVRGDFDFDRNGKARVLKTAG